MGSHPKDCKVSEVPDQSDGAQPLKRGGNRVAEAVQSSGGGLCNGKSCRGLSIKFKPEFGNISKKRWGLKRKIGHSGWGVSTKGGRKLVGFYIGNGRGACALSTASKNCGFGKSIQRKREFSVWKDWKRALCQVRTNVV